MVSQHADAPGANWGYSHTGHVILGQALETITAVGSVLAPDDPPPSR